MSTRLEIEDHAARVANASAWLQAHRRAPVALAKATSNLFRHRAAPARERLDLAGMNHVLDFDAHAGWVDVEGTMAYEDLVAWCVPRGFMPAVVPELKSITVGGAAAGVGIEATSFRHGLVHETLREIDVLLPHGEVVTCTPGNEHSDLFFGFPNSYGTLGYAVRLRASTLPVQPHVSVRHTKFADAATFFEALAQACAGDADFVEGVAFGPGECVMSVGRFAPWAPWRSDYTWMRQYWKSLREREEDYLATADWLWRWDTDWFWCSRNVGAQHALVRLLLGRRWLNSRTYTRVMRLNARWQLARKLSSVRRSFPESVVQDVDIPFDRAPEFLAFLQRHLGIAPLWVCPVRGEQPGRRFPLYRLDRAPLYANFGIWGVIDSKTDLGPTHFNRMLEDEVIRLGGITSLYSDNFFTRDEFDRAYGMDEYARLKAKYDPEGRAPHLFDKCAGRA
jgi:FAD/FMN-containing dehydrogenase